MNRRVTVGVTLAAGAAALLAVVGPQAAVREATRLPPRRLASLVVVGTAPVVVWGVSLRLAARGAGTRPSLGRAVAGFTALSFANVVTPFGQAGGDPPAAAVIARGFGADFETGLAAVGGLNLANRAAAVGVGLVAAVVVADSLPVPLPAVLFAGVALAALVGLVVWGRRRTVVRWTTDGLARLAAPAARLPRLDPPGAARLAERGDRFLDAVDRLASEPARLFALFWLGVIGHVLVAATLWVALAAVSRPPTLLLALVAVPVAKLGGLTPTPGGTGGVEAVLTGVLVAGGVDPAAAAVAVLLHRAVAFWLPAAAGSLAVGWLTTTPPTRNAPPARNTQSTRNTPPNDHGRDDVTDGSTPMTGNGTPVTDPTSDGPGTATPGRTRARWRGSFLTLVGTVLAVGLAVIAVHRFDLFVEPVALGPHVTRDGAVVLVAGMAAWLLVDRVVTRLE